MSAGTKSKNTGGRPKGAKNKQTDQVVTEASRCRRCESTNRAPYFNRIVQQFSGIYRGKPYTHVIKRRTSCKDCGQHRVDVFFVNEPNGLPADGEPELGDEVV